MAVSETFITDDFLLHSEAARRLYHDYAADQPIIDYHCHLPAVDIATDRRFATITAAWLAGDHYKWRALRTFGVAERLVTGDADDREKFLAWAGVVPRTVRNPLYHWTHLELLRYFDEPSLLDSSSAGRIYEETSATLSEGAGYSVRGLLRRMNVRLVCTTDDPADDLAAHERLSAEPSDVVVLPAFRPDRALAVDGAQRFRAWVSRLEGAVGRSLPGLDDLLGALSERHDYFHDRGCRLADYGLEHVPHRRAGHDEAEAVYTDLRAGRAVDPVALDGYRGHLLHELARLHHAADWTQQLHLGAYRDNNSRMVARVGQAKGYDCIGDFSQMESLVRFLDELEKEDRLARTILYVLNPRDNETIASVLGSFQDGRTVGKIQFGSGWWFNDQRLGMERQMNALSNIAFISPFVGMLTDSRSFLSFPRHEYFRRVLCNLFGDDIERGELPADYDLIGGVVKDICHDNARRYFRFPGMEAEDSGRPNTG